MSKTSTELVTYLRAVADFYEEHPKAPLPLWLTGLDLGVYLTEDNAKQVLASIGSFTKTFEGERFVATKEMGGGILEFRVGRESVCTKRVVGTKTVPASFEPKRVTPAKFIEAHEEEIVEWDCEPILAEKEVSHG